MGKICIVSGEVMSQQTWEGVGQDTALKLPKPIGARIFGVGVYYYNDTKTTKVVIGSDGHLYFQNGVSGIIYGFSISYIAKED